MNLFVLFKDPDSVTPCVMKKQTLADSERTLDLLQTIDYTFSQINKVLRDLNSKIIHTHTRNKGNLQKLRPWFNFFSIDLHEKVEKKESQPEDHQSHLVTEEKILSKEIINETSSDFENHLPDLRLNQLYEESSPKNSSSNMDNISRDDILEQIFNLIKTQQMITLDMIHEKFKEVPSESLDGYIGILIDKRRIGCRDSTFYIR